jgi:hypothetical protein
VHLAGEDEVTEVGTDRGGRAATVLQDRLRLSDSYGPTETPPARVVT